MTTNNHSSIPVSYTHLDVYKRQGEQSKPDEEVVGFDIDQDILDEESKKQPLDKSEPIIETVSSQFELDEDDLDRPAFLRKGAKITDRKTTDDDDDSIPAFIKRKL